MKLFLNTILLIVISPLFAAGQNSSVVLSSLKVSDVADPTLNQLNIFLIDLTVGEPSSLSRLEIALEDENGTSGTVQLSAASKNGNVQLTVDGYAVPFDGKKIMFSLKVRDQIIAPYVKILVKGYDQAGQPTNQLVYNRLN